VLGVRGLEEIDADLNARNLGGDREHRHLTPVRVVEAIDQVKIAGTATAGADRQLPGQMRLRRSTPARASASAM
jgi:hypothetical protein